MKAIVCVCLAGAFMLSSAGVVLGQDAQSAPLAAKLAAALDAAKAVNIAAKDPSQPDVFVAALYMPGLQLLVISGKYAAPVLLDQRLAAREYRELYLDLNEEPIVGIAAATHTLRKVLVGGMKAADPCIPDEPYLEPHGHYMCTSQIKRDINPGVTIDIHEAKRHSHLLLDNDPHKACVKHWTSDKPESAVDRLDKANESLPPDRKYFQAPTNTDEWVCKKYQAVKGKGLIPVIVPPSDPFVQNYLLDGAREEVRPRRTRLERVDASHHARSSRAGRGQG